MDYQRVSSSSIDEVGYDSGQRTLAICFHTGGEYLYADVPREIFEALLSASSIGAYFNSEIRNSYPYQRIR